MNTEELKKSLEGLPGFKFLEKLAELLPRENRMELYRSALQFYNFGLSVMLQAKTSNPNLQDYKESK